MARGTGTVLAVAGIVAAVAGILGVLAWVMAGREGVSTGVSAGDVEVAPVHSPVATSAAAPVHSPVATSAAALADTTGSVLATLRLEPPTRDLMDLALRLGGRDAGAAANGAPAAPCRLGARDPFWVHDIENQRYFQIDAVVRVVTENVCVWVQEGESFGQEGLERGAHEFSDEIMPALRSVFGHEWSPGIDGDTKVHVLHHESIPGVAGFFSSADAVPSSANPYSNERDLFYINLASYRPGSYDYLSLLAHEFQHMIQFQMDRDETGWVNEGLSELAPHFVGYGAQNGAALFAAPDTALTDWDPEGGANTAHYAAAYAFFAYLRARFGDEAISEVSAASANGANGVEEALRALGHELTFDEVFADWTVANLVGGAAGNGRLEPRHHYGGAVTGAVVPEPLDAAGAVGSVAQYGADYWDATELVRDGGLSLSFRGDPHVGLLDPWSDGRGRVWWSGRGDGANSRLTRTFDLADASRPNLVFRMWHDLERGWDYGYASLSSDRGRSWERIRLSTSSDDNANGGNYGGGITGSSLGWMEETVDLSAWAGGPITLRFETVTDETVNLAGMALDDIRIDAVGFADDAESDLAWHAEGWTRVPELLPQRWSLQVVVATSDRVRVIPIGVAADGQATIELADIAPDATVTLVVSGMTPGTRNVGGYALESLD